MRSTFLFKRPNQPETQVALVALKCSKIVGKAKKEDEDYCKELLASMHVLFQVRSTFKQIQLVAR